MPAAATSGETAFDVHAVSKAFGTTQALDRVDLSVTRARRRR